MYSIEVENQKDDEKGILGILEIKSEENKKEGKLQLTGFIGGGEIRISFTGDTEDSVLNTMEALLRNEVKIKYNEDLSKRIKIIKYENLIIGNTQSATQSTTQPLTQGATQQEVSDLKNDVKIDGIFEFNVEKEKTFIIKSEDLLNRIGELVIEELTSDFIFSGNDIDDSDLIDDEFRETPFLGSEEEIQFRKDPESESPSYINQNKENIQNGNFDSSGINKLQFDLFTNDGRSDEYFRDLSNSKKSSIDTVIAACKKYKITNNYLIASMLAICSKESDFVLNGENSYRGTPAPKIRGVFGGIFGKPGSPKTIREGYEYLKIPGLKTGDVFTDKLIDTIKSKDYWFWEVVYGMNSLYQAEGNSKGNRYGNNSPGDGERYVGRGFNGITFKDIYKKRGDEIGINLVAYPDKLNEVGVAAEALLNYFITGLTTLPNPSVYGYNKVSTREQSISQLNSTKSICQGVMILYQLNAGAGKKDGKLSIEYENTKIGNDRGELLFGKDIKAGKNKNGAYDLLPDINATINGYERARNRAPGFFNYLNGKSFSEISKDSRIQNQTA